MPSSRNLAIIAAAILVAIGIGVVLVSRPRLEAPREVQTVVVGPGLAPDAPRRRKGEALPPPGPTPVAAVAALEPPAARPSDYVGTEACAGCHAAITELYRQHPMGQSMDTIPPQRSIEDPAAPQVFSDREREYVVEERGDVVLHHEAVHGPDGEALYDQAMAVRFAIGSGTRGRSYLIDHDGLLFQSPIGWFTGTRRYGISPGYEHDRTLRFERSIGDGCLHCHAGLVEHDGDRSDRYSRSVFAEASIGCERCHGPGGGHVATMTALPAGAKADDLRIVNPVDLEPSRREAVCNQCHLGGEATIPRFGRGFYDFRPGDFLDDTRLVFVHDEKSRAVSGEKPVSQVEQMRQSGCWEGTGGAIGCVSCHDPHAKPKPEEMDAFYRTKCNACHADKPCSLPSAEQGAPPANGSCIRCHMPSQALREVAHTAMTDHRVPRGGPDEPPAAKKGPPPGLVAFDDAAKRVPPRELERARGLALASLPGTGRSTAAAQEAISALVPRGLDVGDIRPIVAALAGDPAGLRGLGELFAQTGRMDAAAACWEGALEADPADAETMTMIALQMQRSGRATEALRMLDRVVATNPWVSAVHAQRGALLASMGRFDEAIDAATTSLDLDPSRQSVRNLLADLLDKVGRGDEAAAQRKIVSGLKSAAASPFRRDSVNTEGKRH